MPPVAPNTKAVFVSANTKDSVPGGANVYIVVVAVMPLVWRGTFNRHFSSEDALRALPHGSSEMKATGRETRPAHLGWLSFAREAKPFPRFFRPNMCAFGSSPKVPHMDSEDTPSLAAPSKFSERRYFANGRRNCHSGGFPMKYGPDRDWSGKV